MSKYESLPQFLGSAHGSTKRMSFAEIERILGFKLPKSAYEHEAWWSNNATGHSHARAWLLAGWRTEDVDLAGRKVTFQRSAKSPIPTTVISCRRASTPSSRKWCRTDTQAPRAVMPIVLWS